MRLYFTMYMAALIVFIIFLILIFIGGGADESVLPPRVEKAHVRFNEVRHERVYDKKTGRILRDGVGPL